MPCNITSTLPAALLPPVAAPAGMLTPGARRRSLVPPAPLAELTRLKAHHLGPCVALPTRAHSRIGAVCWRPSLCRVDTWTPPPVQLTILRLRTDKISPFECPSWRPLPLRLCATRAHARPTALSPRRAVTSLSLSLRKPRCSHTRNNYKRRPPHCLSYAPALLSASGKPPPPRLASASTTPSMPSRLTHFPSSCACPGGSPELEAAPRAAGPPPSPSLSSGAIDRTGELRISVACPPRYQLVLWIVSGGCAVAHGCAPLTPSRRTADFRPAPPAPRRADYASPQ
jgi:hypothetical protein